MPKLVTPFSKVFKIRMIVPSRKRFYSEWKNSTPLLIPVTIDFTKFVRHKHLFKRFKGTNIRENWCHPRGSNPSPSA